MFESVYISTETLSSRHPAMKVALQGSLGRSIEPGHSLASGPTPIAAASSSWCLQILFCSSL